MPRALPGGVRSQAHGDVLEVAIGTGLNLSYYPTSASITGVDISQAMLAIAHERTDLLDFNVDLTEADATNLTFPGSVLKPSGRLLLADHIASTNAVERGVQRVLEGATVRCRASTSGVVRPRWVEAMPQLRAEGRERFGPFGIVERLVAVKDVAS